MFKQVKSVKRIAPRYFLRRCGRGDSYEIFDSHYVNDEGQPCNLCIAGVEMSRITMGRRLVRLLNAEERQKQLAKSPTPPAASSIGRDGRWEATKELWAEDEEMAALLNRIESVIAPTFDGNPVEAIKAILAWGASVDEESHKEGSAGVLSDFRRYGLPPAESYAGQVQ